MGGMKQRLMAQAAAAHNSTANNNEETGVVDGSDDALWKIQEEILKPDNLTSDLDLQYHHEVETENRSEDEGISSSRFKFQTALDKQFVFNFKTASPRGNICKIDWASECKGVQRSEAGAEGVFFVSTTTGAVVIKGSRSIAPEMFSCMLGVALGVYCPRWRLIGTSSSEGKVLMRSLISLDPSGRIQTSIGAQTHVLLKAFLPGLNFGSIGERRANEIFGVPGKLSENGKTRLRELGRILALDVLCNNGDRFPLIWDNRGNPGNVMMANGLGKSVSIDSQIQPIDGKLHPNELETYLQKVRALSVALSENGGEQGLPQFMNVCTKLSEFSHRVFAETEAIELQRGYLEVTTNKETFSITQERLERWQTALASYTPSLVGLNGVDVEFVLKVWQCM
eukprot:m.79125 g.79125  ORF g.79125 m.79125 type:complete len:396 (+) comp25182_c0_seq1:44-1231(+)